MKTIIKHSMWLILCMGLMTACDSDTEDAGEAIGETTEDAADAVEDTAEDAADAVEDAADDVERKVD